LRQHFFFLQTRVKFHPWFESCNEAKKNKASFSFIAYGIEWSGKLPNHIQNIHLHHHDEIGYNEWKSHPISLLLFKSRVHTTNNSKKSSWHQLAFMWLLPLFIINPPNVFFFQNAIWWCNINGQNLIPCY